ncbi:sn-glycerol-3-phosphate import ATP-binding protein UgpC [Tritonibacter multivorans]|uniref:sn-glycerol-3-phosphate import ATP-binding protein UgpC n=1 Tax=Tritonibacter multivorans TaxID=928856 RepID=A0A0P1G089_9RHOB|nr:ABC transporter ATP-binding protein [Tritonibacter multivorans]MDA7422470.1 ABC transporter ATP-binding protein [Tritonibacter multivorans]CUH74882.1 sn-glycerol-3-phosphate import ATP-binding protein UgpC [Tritonibacter multivorans]SFD43083.1 carbohydrate ABC transporter ATP-binding protein, CUT1 family (TC 3.A.1.1.-) [Tritonibacter multivorans]
MSQISLSGIHKSFGSTEVLKGVSLDIEAGEFVTLVGPSGCGKSTLLRILAGLDSADTGDVRIQAQSVTQTRAADRNLAMVFQSYALYPHLSVAENMMTPLKMRELGWAGRLPIVGPLVARRACRDIHARVEAVAETLKITPLLARKPGQLSGGQRQRVALGRAMVRDPVAFLMDEPLSNLDAALRVHMRAELSELHRRLNATFVYVTHDQAEALTMSDRMAVMMQGEILQVGPPDEIYHNPASLAVARFIGSPAINVLPGEKLADGRVVLLGQRLFNVQSGQPRALFIGLRPEHLHLAAEGRFEGMISHRENLGSDLFLHLTLKEMDNPVVIRAHPDQARNVARGHNVRFDLDPAKVLFFEADGQRVTLDGARQLEVAQ